MLMMIYDVTVLQNSEQLKISVLKLQLRRLHYFVVV
jgi:hypothetical protein